MNYKQYFTWLTKTKAREPMTNTNSNEEILNDPSLSIDELLELVVRDSEIVKGVINRYREDDATDLELTKTLRTHRLITTSLITKIDTGWD